MPIEALTCDQQDLLFSEQVKGELLVVGDVELLGVDLGEDIEAGAALGLLTSTATSTFLPPRPSIFLSHSQASLHFSTSHSKALAKPFIMALASGFMASQTLSTICRKPSQLLYAAIMAVTSAPIAVIIKPIGFIVSTRFRIFCTPVHIVEPRLLPFVLLLSPAPLLCF